MINSSSLMKANDVKAINSIHPPWYDDEKRYSKQPPPKLISKDPIKKVYNRRRIVTTEQL